MKSINTKIGVLSVLLLIAGGLVWFLIVQQELESDIVESQDQNRKSTAQNFNVVLISIDTCRADHLSCYGYLRKTTPNIDSVASEGILFTNTISPAPLTLPAHGSMLTGTIPPYHGMHDNHDYKLDPSIVSIAEVLKDNGFTTGAIISVFVLDSQFGIDQGFDSYNDQFEESSGLNSSKERRGAEASRFAMQWLQQHQSEKFFLFLHYYDPHSHYVPPEPFASQFPNSLYAGEIAYTDHCIGQVIKKLKKLRLYDSTLIIITSDHGEMLGEHNEATHGYFIYQSAIKVPLIFKLPGQNKSKIIDHVVGLIDIVPTVCRLLDIEIPAQVQGKDLSGYFGRKQPQAQDRYIYCESLPPTKYNANSLLGLVTNRWKYIQTTRPELYDLAEDPQEKNNLIKQQPHRGRILQYRLKQILEQTAHKGGSDSKLELDSKTKAALESLGYVAGAVAEDYEFNQTKDDPKDVIDFHNALLQSRLLIYEKQYAEAELILEKMVQERPECFLPYLNLARIALLREDFAAAVPHLTKALGLNPDRYDAHCNISMALIELGQIEEGIKHLKEAIRLKPELPVIYKNLGDALTQQKKFDQAIEHFDKSLLLNPNQPPVLRLLGNAYYQQEKLELAVEYWDKALGLKQDWPSVLSNLALLKAKYEDEKFHDPNEALRLARRACELTDFKSPSFLDTLSVAYAANERFAEAVETAEKALGFALAQPANQQQGVEEIRKRLELYRRAQKDSVLDGSG